MDASELLERYAAGERDFCGADLEYAELSGANLGLNWQSYHFRHLIVEAGC